MSEQMATYQTHEDINDFGPVKHDLIQQAKAELGNPESLVGLDFVSLKTMTRFGVANEISDREFY
jgi:hypothetical protein